MRTLKGQWYAKKITCTSFTEILLSILPRIGRLKTYTHKGATLAILEVRNLLPKPGEPCDDISGVSRETKKSIIRVLKLCIMSKVFLLSKTLQSWLSVGFHPCKLQPVKAVLFVRPQQDIMQHTMLHWTTS